MKDESGRDSHLGEKRVNGHRLTGMQNQLQSSDLSSEDHETWSYDFDVPEAMSSIVKLSSEIAEDGYTAQLLGTKREGNAIVLDDSGLILTIGYLITEATSITLEDSQGQSVPAELVAYDYDTGFGLVRATRPLQARPIEIGVSSNLATGDRVLVAGFGGMDQALNGQIIAIRGFAGYWEYMLTEAIFVSPPHPNWGGTGLIDDNGTLVGLGSLYIEDIGSQEQRKSGTMFLPIDMLKPIFNELLEHGRTTKPARPWLGIFTAENEGRLEVIAVAPDGPAERAGIKAGDTIVKIGATVVNDLTSMYRCLWDSGSAGTVIRITTLRDTYALHLEISSEDRYTRLKFLRE